MYVTHVRRSVDCSSWTGIVVVVVVVVAPQVSPAVGHDPLDKENAGRKLVAAVSPRHVRHEGKRSEMLLTSVSQVSVDTTLVSIARRTGRHLSGTHRTTQETTGGTYSNDQAQQYGF